MNATADECSLYEEPKLGESAFEFSPCIRPQFKDANEFGSACRSLALSANSRKKRDSMPA
jgi:hypothetical protein